MRKGQTVWALTFGEARSLRDPLDPLGTTVDMREVVVVDGRECGGAVMVHVPGMAPGQHRRVMADTLFSSLEAARHEIRVRKVKRQKQIESHLRDRLAALASEALKTRGALEAAHAVWLEVGWDRDAILDDLVALSRELSLLTELASETEEVIRANREAMKEWRAKLAREWGL